jgi:ATP-dependent Lon protease
VGGIKEKLLAATRAGIKDVIFVRNRKDVEEIKKEYLKNLNIHYVNKMKEVIEIAL